MKDSEKSCETDAIPRVGMLATVRNRRGMIAAVDPFDSSVEGRSHLVSIEYLDADGPLQETLLWEREPGARLLEPTALPDPVRDAPMAPEEFDALVNATRWTALTPFVDPDGKAGPLDRLPVSDRAFRIGQHKNVLVYKFVRRGTVEDKIDTLIEEKKGLAQELLEEGGEKLLTEMSNDELPRFVALDIKSAKATMQAAPVLLASR